MRSGKVGTRICGPDMVSFRHPSLPVAFFYLKIGLDIGRVFTKC